MTNQPHHSLTATLFTWVRAWAAELAATTAAIVLLAYIERTFGAGIQLLVLPAAALVFAAPPVREQARRLLGRRARMRRWRQALSGVVPPPATPHLVEFRDDPAGSWAAVRTGPGGTVTELETRTEHLAAWLGAFDIRVERHPSHSGKAWLRALHRDPLDVDPGPWPWLTAARTSLHHPVPVGVDENGQPVRVGLVGHNLLVGGEPGSGKSVAISQIVAAAALDPDCRLWLLDGKLVELAAWAAAADGTAGVDIFEANQLLADIQAEMDGRYRQLLEQKLRKIGGDWGLHMVVVDELAHYSTWGDRKPRDRFNDLLRDLVSRGRAAGIIVVAATQKPGSDTVPTNLRDLFGYRWALRCTTPAASDTILGAGWAARDITAHSINPAQHGVGWLHHETSHPQRLRSHHLTDRDLTALARRAATVRGRPT